MVKNGENKAKNRFQYLVFDPASQEFVKFNTIEEAQDYGKQVWWKRFDVLQIKVIQVLHFEKIFENERY